MEKDESAWKMSDEELENILKVGGIYFSGKVLRGENGTSIMVNCDVPEIRSDLKRIITFHSSKEVEEFIEMCKFFGSPSFLAEKGQEAQIVFKYYGKSLTIEETRKLFESGENIRRQERIEELKQSYERNLSHANKSFNPNEISRQNSIARKRVDNLKKVLQGLLNGEEYNADNLKNALTIEETEGQQLVYFDNDCDEFIDIRYIQSAYYEQLIANQYKAEQEALLEKIEAYRSRKKPNVFQRILGKKDDEYKEKFAAIDEKLKKEKEGIEQQKSIITDYVHMEKKIIYDIIPETQRENYHHFSKFIEDIYKLPLLSEERMHMMNKLISDYEQQAKQEKMKRNAEENYAELHKKKEKEKRVLKDLRKQFQKNLTEEQKDAIILYQSLFFVFFSRISSIENYEELSDEQVYNVLKGSQFIHQLSPGFGKYINHISTGDKLATLIKKVIPNGCKMIDFSKAENSEQMIDVIHNIREQIDIMKNIPKDSIVLSEDLVLYRGTQMGAETVDTDFPATGEFMSTTLLSQNANSFNDKRTLFKLHLKKGTPILYSPYMILSDPFGRLSLIQRDLDTELSDSNEIIINTNDILPITDKSVETYSCIDFNGSNGIIDFPKLPRQIEFFKEIIEQMPYRIIEGTMEPREVYRPRDREEVEM